MKNFYFVMSIVFLILTIAGAGYVLYRGGHANPGCAVIPMLCGLMMGAAYRNRKLQEKR